MADYHPDPAKLRELATKWRAQATRLDTYRKLLTEQVDAIDWAGHGKTAAAQAAKDLSAQIAETSKNANDWATELDRIAAEIEKQLEMKKLAMALFFGFFLIGIIAAVVLLPVVTLLATFLAGILATVVSATLAAQIALFAAGFVIFGALAVALDFGAGALDARLRGEKFTPTWENALMIIVGALTGGLFLLKPTALVEKVVTTLGNKGIGNGPKVTGAGARPGTSSSPDIQIINHVNGDSTTLGLGPRPVPPPKLGVGGVQKVIPPPVTQAGQVAKPPLVGTTRGADGVPQAPRSGPPISANTRALPPAGGTVGTVKPGTVPPAADVAGVTGGPVRTGPVETGPAARVVTNRPPGGDVIEPFGGRPATPETIRTDPPLGQSSAPTRPGSLGGTTRPGLDPGVDGPVGPGRVNQVQAPEQARPMELPGPTRPVAADGPPAPPARASGSPVDVTVPRGPGVGEVAPPARASGSPVDVGSPRLPGGAGDVTPPMRGGSSAVDTPPIARGGAESVAAPPSRAGGALGEAPPARSGADLGHLPPAKAAAPDAGVARGDRAGTSGFDQLINPRAAKPVGESVSSAPDGLSASSRQPRPLDGQPGNSDIVQSGPRAAHPDVTAPPGGPKGVVRPGQEASRPGTMGENRAETPPRASETDPEAPPAYDLAAADRPPRFNENGFDYSGFTRTLDADGAATGNKPGEVKGTGGGKNWLEDLNAQVERMVQPEATPVFRVDVSDVPGLRDGLFPGSGKGSPAVGKGALPELGRSSRAPDRSAGETGDPLAQRPAGAKADPDAPPRYEQIAEDSPPRMVDGEDYGFVKALDHDVFAPAAVRPKELKGSSGRAGNWLDDIHVEIDRIMAERRTMAENASGGEARASVTTPRDPADHTSFAAEKTGAPSLRERALDAMARHEELVEQSRFGVRHITGVPTGTVQEAPKGGGGKPYSAIRDDLFRIGDKPDRQVAPPAKASATGPSLPAAQGVDGQGVTGQGVTGQGVKPQGSEAAGGSAALEHTPLASPAGGQSLVSSRALETQTYTRELTSTELRTGFEGVVHERRQLLIASGSGREFDLSFAPPSRSAPIGAKPPEGTTPTSQAPAKATEQAPEVTQKAPQLSPEDRQRLIDQRLNQLDQIEGALVREWESRFGASSPPVHRLPSTEVTGRSAIEAELRQAVDLRRFELTGVRPTVKGLPEGVDVTSAIRQAEAALLNKTVEVDRSTLQRDLHLAEQDMARVMRDAANAQAKARAATSILRGDAPAPAAEATRPTGVIGDRVSLAPVLTPRETTVLQQVAKGRSSEAIAGDLRLPVGAVEAAVTRAVTKLEGRGLNAFGSRPEVPLSAREAGLLRQVAAGRPVDAIAGELKLPPKAVEFLLGRILNRLEGPSAQPVRGATAETAPAAGGEVQPGQAAPVRTQTEVHEAESNLRNAMLDLRDAANHSYKESVALHNARQALADQGPPEISSWAIAAGTTQVPAPSVVSYRGAAASAGGRGTSGHVLNDVVDIAAGPDRTVPVRLQDSDAKPTSGYLLRGAPPADAPPEQIRDNLVSDVAAASLAPGIRGAVRILPDVNALPNLGRFIDALPPWLRYRVVLDLRLIPAGTQLPFRPGAFATRHLVQVDVPHQTVQLWVLPEPAPGESAGGYGYLVGWNGQRTTEQFASAYRWTPTPMHVPAPTTGFGPGAPSRKLFDPAPIPPSDLDLARFQDTSPAESDVFEHPLPSGWIGTSLGGGRTWVHPPEVTTVADVVRDHEPQPGETRIFIGGVGIETPEAVWADLRRIIEYAPRDVAARFEFQSLGTTLPPVLLTDADHHHTASSLPPEAQVSAKVAELASQVFPNPTVGKIADALNELARFAWQGQVEGVPRPGVRLGAPSLVHRIGEFDYIGWQVVLRSPTSAQVAAWTNEDWRRYGALAGHELVHADQFVSVARYLAVEHDTEAKLAEVLPTKRTELLKEAIRKPLTPGTAEFDHGKALYESLIGAQGLAQRQASDSRLANFKGKFQEIEQERRFQQYVNFLDPARQANLALDGLRWREAYTRELNAYRTTLHELPAFGLEHVIETGPGAVTPTPVEASVFDGWPPAEWELPPGVQTGPSLAGPSLAGPSLAGAAAGHPAELAPPSRPAPAVDPAFADLVGRATRVARWHDLLDPLVRSAAAERGSAELSAWESFGEQLTRTLRTVDQAAQGRPEVPDPDAAFANLILAYGLAFDSLLGRSIGWDFLPTTAELTGRAPIVAKPAGVAGTWLTWRLRMALGGLSRTGDPGITAIADQWQALVAEHRDSLTPDALDQMLAFVENVRARQTQVGDGPVVAVAPRTATSSPAESVVRAWLAQDAWATSAGYFGQHASTLVGPEAAAALRDLLAANPDDAKLRLHGALLDLARQGYGEKAYEYLTRGSQHERKQVLIDLARSTTDPAAFRAIGQLPDGVDPSAGPVSFSELAYGKMMTSINWFLDGEPARALELATDARRHLSGRARIDFLKVLRGLEAAASPATGPRTSTTAAADVAGSAPRLHDLKLIIVDC